jgi:hypothetical protein
VALSNTKRAMNAARETILTLDCSFTVRRCLLTLGVITVTLTERPFSGDHCAQPRRGALVMHIDAEMGQHSTIVVDSHVTFMSRSKCIAQKIVVSA